MLGVCPTGGSDGSVVWFDGGGGGTNSGNGVVVDDRDSGPDILNLYIL